MNHVCPVILQIPKLAIMSVVRPCKWICFVKAVFLEQKSQSPALVICKGMPIFLKQRVDPWNTAVPKRVQVFNSHLSVLETSFAAYACIVAPNSVAVFDFTLPCLNVSVKSWDKEAVKSASASITQEQAKNIALQHAGISSPSYIKAEFDSDDNKYDVEFKSDNTEYEYEINASNGNIIKWESDRDD